VKFIRALRIRWLDHLKRMEAGAMPRRMMEVRLFKGRRKTASEMDRRCSGRFESNEDKTVDSSGDWL
jgi:hypothetical protein